MSMDLGQLTQMTTWLDEEHRRDKAELIKLQQELQRQETEQLDQGRIVKDLEGRVAGMQAQFQKAAQFSVALQQLKEEVVHMLAQSDERRQQEERERERVRAVERENVSRAVNEIRRELQRLPRLDEEMALRKAEQHRVGESLLNVQQELAAVSQETEKRLRSLSFLEDGRQQDTKRIARLQQESLDALKRLEQQGSRLQMLEDAIQRQERDTGELKELVSQLRKAHREFTEGQLLEIEKLRREMGEWFQRLETYAKTMDDFSTRMEAFSDAFREDRQVVDNIQRFQEQLKREQNQVSELQRLAEERQRHQLEQWQEENEKRWNKETLRRDHQWAEQGQRNKQIAGQFRDAEERLARHRAELDWVWKYFQSEIAYQQQEMRRWSGDMTKLLEERPKKE